jgi:hypothetical protein
MGTTPAPDIRTRAGPRGCRLLEVALGLVVHDKSPFLRLASVRPWSLRLSRSAGNKKADVAEHPQAFDHVGLLFNKPPGSAEVPFI